MKGRESLKKWDQFVSNIRKLKVIDNETQAEKEQRIARLKKDFVAFSKYYFPEYVSSDFADFHLRIARKVIRNDSIYLVAALPREHAKSVLMGLLLPAYLMFTERMYNMLLVSHNETNAQELLMPLILNLEHNQRIIHDFGKQKGFRKWEEGNWHTVAGCSFRSIGAKQSPRGTRNEEKRPDLILIDDIDTDEEARNQKRIDDKWKWVEEALFPTMSISGSKRFLFAGNIISKESCIVKASRMADHFEKVEILSKDGQPAWKERYSLDDVNYMLSKISYAAGQKEYFNNPITEGTVFKDLRWGKVPRPDRFKFLVAYGDPSPSNSENRKGSDKAVVLVGRHGTDFYVIKAFVERQGNTRFIEWFHDMDAHVRERTVLYHYMENNGLQDPFYEQVYLPIMKKVGEQRGKVLYVLPDERKKPDKFTRIEGTLEPIHRAGSLIFNEKEKDNPHMQRLVEQFELVEPTLAANVDGPDAVEGAVWIIQNKLVVFEATGRGGKRRSKKY